MAIVLKRGEPKRILLSIACLLVVLGLLLVAFSAATDAVRVGAYVGVGVFTTAALVLVHRANRVAVTRKQK